LAHSVRASFISDATRHGWLSSTHVPTLVFGPLSLTLPTDESIVHARSRVESRLPELITYRRGSRRLSQLPAPRGARPCSSRGCDPGDFSVDLTLRYVSAPPALGLRRRQTRSDPKAVAWSLRKARYAGPRHSPPPTMSGRCDRALRGRASAYEVRHTPLLLTSSVAVTSTVSRRPLNGSLVGAHVAGSLPLRVARGAPSAQRPAATTIRIDRYLQSTILFSKMSALCLGSLRERHSRDAPAARDSRRAPASAGS